MSFDDAGPWVHNDGTSCPSFTATRKAAENGQPWWCTEHQQHVRSTSHDLRSRDGDQALPTGDLSTPDDQSLLIQDIEERRLLGIERYGEGHRPFNGRNTMLDLYEEQLDLMVYLRSIRRMSESSEEEIVAVISKVIQANGFQAIIGDAMARVIYERLQGYFAAKFIEGNSSV